MNFIVRTNGVRTEKVFLLTDRSLTIQTILSEKDILLYFHRCRDNNVFDGELPFKKKKTLTIYFLHSREVPNCYLLILISFVVPTLVKMVEVLSRKTKPCYL